MVALVPFTLERVVDAVVEAGIRELTSARQELASVRAAAATAREVLEAKIGELEQQLADRDGELDQLLEACGGADSVESALRWPALKQRRIVELQARIAELEGELTKSPKMGSDSPIREADPGFVRSGEIASNEGPKPEPPRARRPALARPATEAERAAPPQNPRLTGLSTLVGLTFGTWKVVDRAGGGVGMTYWKCVCINCGARKELAAIGAWGLRTRAPWCSACRASKKGSKTQQDPAEREEADDQEDGE